MSAHKIIWCILTSHEWSDWFREDAKKLKECERCGLCIKDTGPPLIPDGGELPGGPTSDNNREINTDEERCRLCGKTRGTWGLMLSHLEEKHPELFEGAIDNNHK